MIKRIRHLFLPYKILLTKKSRNILVVLIACLVLIFGAYTYYYHKTSVDTPLAKAVYKTDAEKNVYVRFDMEAYDIIKKNYWYKMSDENMAQLFQLSLQKAGTLDAVPEIVTKDRKGVADMIESVLLQLPNDEARKKLAIDTLVVATYNLQPNGRSGLLSSKQETELRQTVSNINPTKDLYKDLGVEKGAPAEKVEETYKEKAVVLEKSTSPEAKAELEKITYARKVLTNDSSKKLYDERQIEPTVTGKVLGNTLYLAISKISPSTLQEFGLLVDNASTTPNLDSMIIDFRGNIGGSLDFLMYFLGLFIGQNQYAFDLFHQDEYQVQRTTLPKYDRLARYKELAIMIDSMSQSTAELTTATFKKFNLAHVVGETTRGWGTVENTYPITTVIGQDESYSLLLVNSLTLRDDNTPIEGRGVDPDINIKSTTWKNDLKTVFRNQSLIKALNVEVLEQPLR